MVFVFLPQEETSIPTSGKNEKNMDIVLTVSGEPTKDKSSDANGSPKDNTKGWYLSKLSFWMLLFPFKWVSVTMISIVLMFIFCCWFICSISSC